MTAPFTSQTTADHFARNKREIIEIPVDSITPFPYQARRVFDEAALAELAASIQSHGLINPITVHRGAGDIGWQLIAGERRLRAVKLLGLPTIEAIVREGEGSARAMQASIIENLQRQDLDPIDEARGYRTLIDVSGMTQSQVAEAIGRSQPAIANTMRLLELPESVLSLVSAGQLSASHARALVQYAAYPAVCQKIAELAIEEGWTSKRLEAGFAGGYYDGVSAYKVGVELLTPIEYNHRTAAEAAGLTVWDNHTPDVAQYRELVEAREAERKAQLEAQMQAARDAAKADRSEEPANELPLDPDAGDFAPGRDPNTKNGRRRIEKDAQKAAREGLPKLSDLPYGTYEVVEGESTYGAAWPKACGADCECRAKAVDRDGKVVDISTRPRHISALRGKEARQQKEKEKQAGLERGERLQIALDAAPAIDSRGLAVAAAHILTSINYASTGVELSVKSEMRQRYFPDARKSLLDYEGNELLDALCELSSEKLSRLMAEALLLSDVRRVAENGGSPSQRLTWYLVAAEGNEAGQEDGSTPRQSPEFSADELNWDPDIARARLTAALIDHEVMEGDEDKTDAELVELGQSLMRREILWIDDDVAEQLQVWTSVLHGAQALATPQAEATIEAEAAVIEDEPDPSDEVELARHKTTSYLRKSGYSIVKDGRIPSDDELYAHVHSQAKGGATKSWDWPRYERALRSVVRREVTT